MKQLLTVALLTGAFSASAQTLFTYGKQSVTANEFLQAYKKNNNAPTSEKALRDYLDLYIASRLKVQEARELRMDTLAQLQADMANLRQQIIPAYTNDRESMDALVKEAFTRSQKDIRAAHIFIAFSKNGRPDAAAADKRKEELMAALAKGTSFEQAARHFSDDPSALANGGDLGWITVFSLPYDLETVLYNTAAGKTSAVYTSKSGHHIFKNITERKAMGRMKASQILLAYPPGADDAYKARVKKTADSLYARLVAGDDFGKLATAFSNDVISAASAGQMGEFGVGEFHPAFEAAAFGLARDGAFSKPVLTPYGYHIIKRHKLVPVAVKMDEEAADLIRRRIEGGDRTAQTQSALAQKIIQQVGATKLLQSDNALWAYSDSVLNGAKPVTPLTITGATPVLKMGTQTTTAADWARFAQAARYRPNGGVKPYPILWDEFVEATALQYHQDHLEDFNPDFKRQLNEFADGNLFFEIMQQKVWTPAQTDSAALENYYNAYKADYVWKQSADAVIFYAVDEKSALDFHQRVKKNPGAWKALAAEFSEKITTDSGRFEVAQIPSGGKQAVTAKLLTAPVVNTADNTASFAFVLRLHPANQPRSFADARGQVITDYQAELEKQWIAELKKKYPVKVDEQVWEGLAKGK